MPSEALQSDIRLTRLGDTLGIAVEGLDLRHPLSDAMVARLHQAQLDHIVVVIRGQTLDAVQYRDAMRVFGTLLMEQPNQLHGDVPEIMILSSENTWIRDDKRMVFGANWHTDGAYLPAPVALTVLYGVEVPSSGGDTQFTNLYAAYEALPDDMKRRIDGLKLVNSRASGRDRGVNPRSDAELEALVAKYPPVVHPLVRTHPETGRKALYLCGERMDHFVGQTRDESEPLLQELLAHAISPQFQYRHKWRQGDVVIWDNRCALHKANGDYAAGERRLMYRLSIEGTVPV